MIIKEAVNNSVKYAKGNLIQLSVYTSNGKLIIKVTDNGNGYDTSATTEGNGLKNIMNRSQQIGYKVTILSAEGQGTTVQLEKK
jgi:signal transduction histidine kinase